MRLKFSSHLKAAQFYGIALTIRSILISVISAVKWNRRLALEADLKSKGQHFIDPHTAGINVWVDPLFLVHKWPFLG